MSDRTPKRPFLPTEAIVVAFILFVLLVPATINAIAEEARKTPYQKCMAYYREHPPPPGTAVSIEGPCYGVEGSLWWDGRS